MTSGYWADRVICPFPGCEHTCSRNNLLGHFRTAKHRDSFPNLHAQALRPMIERAPRVDGQPPTERHLSGRRQASEREPTPRSLSTAPRAVAKRRQRRERKNQQVRCPDCDAIVQRGNLQRHVMGRHPQIPIESARRWARELPAVSQGSSAQGSSPESAAGLALVDRQLPTAALLDSEPNPWHAIDGTDIALGVVLSQVNGSFRVELLPEVVAYVDHTRQLVGRLRAQE